ncbi:tRNA-splicing endonuclease subunit Sen34-like [Homarus americanus]|uniref:tRNA-splicing endonuclease subunit Sen34 n=1 Tax=Homarus americanus TaxID=6706 RepID=A0A8J5MXQ1_HOMAM|nr:tRNA-splicing endonuclease subunit Sen34-like [Homarus americanus]XP_042224043.1 tRNA-splicing endonuclease subunit Sen34-like [Homarus americanus]XP_042224044.1 tRNA-splicing endonuclease subunit Sen34-like [Homarus americanus]XP_042224045.1 tRNA-splicing endonuclease subunit Sen34-like [Homarus americanus]XP_042224046.1 tRNA-splicing endonuclease subunit Sen34-like [Homarus americanus]XP_042224047.1 tRNA-splicing endonuclease subunit Sen34-like [Homarus americanus]XP_042224048.1 tRNA-spl
MDPQAVPEDEHQINLVIAHDQGHLWNVRDVKLAWTKYRIVGYLVGALPRHPHQSTMMGLPLKLLPEEVTLLLEKGFAKPITYQEMAELPSSNILDTFKDLREKCYHEQIVAAVQQRKQEIETFVDTILEGKAKKIEKRKKANSAVVEKEKNELTRENVIREEMRKIQKLPEHYQVIEIFTENPFIDNLRPVAADWTFPTSKMDKLRYAVFKDVWEHDQYLTAGVKFGGDFLVYPGDPHLFHATFIIKCVEDMECVNNNDLVSWSRIATATKKTLVLATLDQYGKVSYQSFKFIEDEFS